MRSLLSSEPVEAGAEPAERTAHRNLQSAYDEARTAITAAPDLSLLPDGELQRLLAVACKEFALRREAGNRFAPFTPEQADTLLSATDAVVVASAVLDALSVEVFELGLWKTWGTT
jgi:hypothetical protein